MFEVNIHLKPLHTSILGIYKVYTHPAGARVGTGRVGRGRVKGGGVLLARVTASFLGEGTQHVTMEFASWCGAIYCILDSVA